MAEQIAINPEKFYNEAKESYQRITREKKSKLRMNNADKAFFIFPLLAKHEIDTWGDLDYEARLIDAKVSELPRQVRDAVTHLHTHCLLQCANEYSKILRDE